MVGRSVAKTGRALVLHEDNRTGGIGAELAASIGESAFGRLLAPVVRVTAPDAPATGYSPSLEDAFIPGPPDVVRAVRRLMAV